MQSKVVDRSLFINKIQNTNLIQAIPKNEAKSESSESEIIYIFLTKSIIMRILFFITALVWAIYLYFVSSYGSLELSLRSYMDVELIYQFTLISWGVSAISLIVCFLSFAKVRKKGSILLGIVSILATIVAGFLGTVVLYDVGAQIHEVAAVLYGVAIVQILIFIIFGVMSANKKTA